MNWSRAEVSGEMPHHGLRSATTTRVGSKIFVFGGRGSPNQPYFHNLYIFDTGTAQDFVLISRHLSHLELKIK
jgi:hypothetical protein